MKHIKTKTIKACLPWNKNEIYKIFRHFFKNKNPNKNINKIKISTKIDMINTGKIIKQISYFTQSLQTYIIRNVYVGRTNQHFQMKIVIRPLKLPTTPSFPLLTTYNLLYTATKCIFTYIFNTYGWCYRNEL